jgi:hypothetical protein
MEKKLFFICGCARSGTTALWQLVSAHLEIAVGVERYINLIHPKFSLSEELFDEKRFFDIKPGDSHFQDFGVGTRGRYYRELKLRYDACKLFGDKIPPLYNFYNELGAAFTGVKILFIFRNVFDVAQSFIARAEQGVNWPKNRDFKVAVTHWNKSLISTLQYIKTGGDVLCLEYEELFWGGVQPEVIGSFLGLSTSTQFSEQLDSLVKQSAGLDQKRGDRLTTPQKQFIMHNANFSAYKEILQLSILQRDGLNA